MHAAFSSLCALTSCAATWRPCLGLALPPPMQLSDLTAMYKSRLTTEGYKEFVALVKQVARMEPGTKYLVLKD